MCIKYYFVIGIFLLLLIFESDLVNANALCPTESICKPIRDCPSLLRRLGYVGSLPFCDTHREKVCCPLPYKPQPPDLTNPWTNACHRYAQILQNKSLEVPYILNGKEAKPHEFPFMALIGRKDKNKPGGIDWNCGGTLITPRWVLTAAHCLQGIEGQALDKSTLVVRLGEHDYSVNNNNTQDFENVNPVISFAYDDFDNQRNDIGLIDLKRNATLNWNVLPACLSTTNATNYKSFQAAGWGSTELGRRSTKLLKAELYPSDGCADHFNEKVEDTNMICAINSKHQQDTCSGDSGGPLFVPNPDIRGTYLVLGITSSGISETCGYKTEDDELPPAYYTKLSANMYWINLHIKDI